MIEAFAYLMIGLWIGVALGIFLMCLLQVSRGKDDE